MNKNNNQSGGKSLVQWRTLQILVKENKSDFNKNLTAFIADNLDKINLSGHTIKIVPVPDKKIKTITKTGIERLPALVIGTDKVYGVANIRDVIEKLASTRNVLRPPKASSGQGGQGGQRQAQQPIQLTEDEMLEKYQNAQMSPDNGDNDEDEQANVAEQIRARATSETQRREAEMAKNKPETGKRNAPQTVANQRPAELDDGRFHRPNVGPASHHGDKAQDDPSNFLNVGNQDDALMLKMFENSGV